MKVGMGLNPDYLLAHDFVIPAQAGTQPIIESAGSCPKQFPLNIIT